MILVTRWLRAPCLLAWAWACALPASAVLPTVPTMPATTTEAVPAVGASGLLQAALGMLMVLALIFLCAWMARRFGLQRFGGGQLVKVISSSMVGQRERVVVVEVGATWLVLGVTGSQINMLHSLPAQAVPERPDQPQTTAQQAIGAFGQKLREAAQGKARGSP